MLPDRSARVNNGSDELLRRFIFAGTRIVCGAICIVLQSFQAMLVNTGILPIMTIEYADVFPILAAALPDFKASELDWQEPLPYIFLGQMQDFVCRTAGSGSFIEIDQFASMLEKLTLEGDNNVQDLVLDALDGLLECDLRDIVAARFGPKVHQLWVERNQLSQNP